MAESNEVIINPEYVRIRLESIIELNVNESQLAELMSELKHVSKRGSNYAKNIMVEAALEKLKHELESVTVW